MKKIQKLLLIGLFTFLGLFLIVPGAEARTYRTKSSDVKVRTYKKKNGTTVKSHYRSKADHKVSNNYSCIDKGRCSKRK